MKYVIVGGTGTLGKAVLKHLYLDPLNTITVLSRDELKQQELRAVYPRVNFVIADIRDKDSLIAPFTGADTVLHFAALKHVDMGEKFPEEFIKTNVTGTINASKVASACAVRYFVFCSTDKAVLPINAYGYSKGMAEKYVLNENKPANLTRHSVFRWGNVIGSRGSVLKSFATDLKERGLYRITDKNMTRFWIHIDDAARFLLENYRHASTKEAVLPPMKASKVTDLAEAVAQFVGCRDFEVEEIGIRPGEKIHECLVSTHSKCVRSDNCVQYTREDLLDLIARSYESFN